MIIYSKKEETIVKDVVKSISCDKCKEVFIIDENLFDPEIENFVHIKKTFCYGSKRDGESHFWNFCEDCIFEILGPASRVVEHD